MSIRWKPLLFNMAVPLALGSLTGYFTMDGMKTFSALEQPPLSPPAWVFPVAWTLLYLMMGAAAYLIFASDAPREERKGALRLYAWQLLVNLSWPVLFFCFGWYGAAFCWLVLLWILVFRTTITFYRFDHKTLFLLLPYLFWVSFAGYLNLGIVLLN